MSLYISVGYLNRLNFIKHSNNMFYVLKDAEFYALQEKNTLKLYEIINICSMVLIFIKVNLTKKYRTHYNLRLKSMKKAFLLSKKSLINKKVDCQKL